MATKCQNLFFAVFLFLLCFVPAQADETEIDFTQRLSWPADRHALRYEVIIELAQDTGHSPLQRLFTENDYLYVSLPPGNYRYGIIPYDFLNRPSADPVWMSFEVFPALKPEIHNFFPLSFFVEENTVYKLNITGKNLIPGAELYLYSLSNTDDVVIPVEANFFENGTIASLVFDSDSAAPGTYGIFVKNPGGMEARATVLTISRKKEPKANSVIGDFVFSHIDLFFGAAWTPLISGNGDQNIFFNNTPMGFGAYLAATAKGERPVNPGLELDLALHHYAESDYEGYLFMYRINLLLQKRLPELGAAVSLRAGVGNGISSGKTPDTNFLNPNLSLGTSFTIMVNERQFLEAGFSYIRLFSMDSFIQPRFGFSLWY